MRYEIHGTVMQTLDVYLTQGESMYTESGGMAWMKGNIDMKTNTKGGLMAGLGRKLAGESLFMTTYTCNDPGEALIVFAPEAPDVISTQALQEDDDQVERSLTKKRRQDFARIDQIFNKEVIGPAVEFRDERRR